MASNFRGEGCHRGQKCQEVGTGLLVPFLCLEAECVGLHVRGGIGVKGPCACVVVAGGKVRGYN